MRRQETDYDDEDHPYRTYPDKSGRPSDYRETLYTGFGNISSVREYNGSVTAYSYDYMERASGVTLPNSGDGSGTIGSS